MIHIQMILRAYSRETQEEGSRRSKSRAQNSQELTANGQYQNRIEPGTKSSTDPYPIPQVQAFENRVRARCPSYAKHYT